MTTLGELSDSEFRRRLRHGALNLRVGPYGYGIRSNLGDVSEGLRTLYRDFPLVDDGAFVDYSVALEARSVWQRARAEAEFLFDGQSPFDPIPDGQAYAFLEWGMNWCVSLHTNEYLKLHAAVVAKDDQAIIMPGVPGAGKSTLCAALGLSGWRILSDEHAMIPPGTTRVVPICRPVSLKNESIDVIRAFATGAVLGPVSRETHKGIVAHMKADLTPDSHSSGALPVGALIFPTYSKEQPQRLAPRRKTESFLLAAYHSFNYSLMCETGFEAMRTLVDTASCYDLFYHDLDWAIEAIEALTRGGQ